jgi:hypothetical protein
VQPRRPDRTGGTVRPGAAPARLRRRDPERLRLLVAAGLADHAEELPGRSGTRAFRRLPSLAFPRRTCLVVTDAGVRAAARWANRHPVPNPHRSGKNGRPRALTPTWDGDRRQLWYGGRLVKQYRNPAANQELLLTAFQEDGWPARIDDPLPPSHGIDPTVRLRQVVFALNHHQASPRLRFIADGTGRGVQWAEQPPGGD